jgi:hypothetical protein
VAVAISVLPTYLTGTESPRLIRELPGVSRVMVQLHQNAAMITLLLMTITGTLAWFGAWEYRRFSRAGFVTTYGTLLATALTVVSILYTAGLGGKISHPEVRYGADTGLTEAVGWREPVELFVGEKSWMWPALETLHFIGMTMLFGVSLLLMLRTLGMMKSISFSGLHRLLPIGVMGFVVNVITGMIFYIALPGNYVNKQTFHIKMLSIILGAIPILYFSLSDAPWKTGSNDNASAIAKVASVCLFVLLVVVVVTGRLLPFYN